MAGTINLTCSLRVSNGGFTDGFAPGPVSVAETNIGVGGGSQSIPTTAGGTAIAGLGGLTALGYAALENLDATHFVTVGIVVSGTYYPVLKLKAREVAVLRLVPGVTYYAMADTAAVLLLCRVWED